MDMIRVDDTTMAEINITPFTDVLLVLLVIFMILAAMVVPPGFQKSLPNCGGCNRPQPRAVIVRLDLVITRAGRMMLGTQPVDERTIYAALAAASAGRKHPRLSIVADGKSRYGLVVRALDAAKAAQIDDVTLVTQ